MSRMIVIPEHIWCMNLSCDYRCLLSIIEYQTRVKGFCDTPNYFLSIDLNCPESRISNMLRELKKNKIVSIKQIKNFPSMWDFDQSITSKREIRFNYDFNNSDIKNRVELENKNKIRLSLDDMEAGKSLKGGYKDVQIKLLGCGKEKGWKTRAIGKFYDKETIKQFIAYSNANDIEIY